MNPESMVRAPDLYAYPQVYGAIRAPDPDLLEGVFRLIRLHLGREPADDSEPLRVLDPACGPGNWLEPFAVRGHHVAGNDLSVEMVEGARHRLADVARSFEVVRGDMRTLALSSGPFDVALEIAGSTGILETSEDLDALFDGVARHLRPGGLFLVTVFLDQRGEGPSARLPRTTHESAWLPVRLPNGTCGEARARYEHLGWRADPPAARMRRTVEMRDLPGHPREVVEEYTLRAWPREDLLDRIDSRGAYEIVETDALGGDEPGDSLGESTFVLRRRS